jgi:CARDB/Divergent InlB B-repeat domain/Dockerin type I domain
LFGKKNNKIFYYLLAGLGVVFLLFFIAFPNVEFSTDQSVNTSSTQGAGEVATSNLRMVGTIVKGDGSETIPLSGVTVELKSLENKYLATGLVVDRVLVSSVVSNENGMFEFSNLDLEKNYEIVPVKEGYRFQESQYSVSGEILKKHFQETPEPFQDIFFQATSISELTNQIKALTEAIAPTGGNLRYNTSADSPDLEGILKERKALMLKLAELEPTEFFNNTLTAETRNSLPVELQKYAETPQTVSGEVNVFITKAGETETVKETSYLFYQGKNLKIFNVEEYKLGPGVVLSIDGYLIDQNVVATTSNRLERRTVPISRYNTEGSFKGRVFKIPTLPTHPNPISREKWESVFVEVKDLYAKESFGKYNIDLALSNRTFVASPESPQDGNNVIDLVNYYLSHLDAYDCDEMAKIAESSKLIFFSEVASATFKGTAISGFGDALLSYNDHCAPIGQQTITRRLGIIVINIDSDYVSLTKPGAEYSELAYILVHELGHTLGFRHAGDPDSKIPQDPMYGNRYEIMGGNFGIDRVRSHFGALYKLAAKWISPSDVINISSSGLYSLNLQESNSGQRLAKLTTGSGANVYLEFWQPKNIPNFTVEDFQGLFILSPQVPDPSLNYEEFPPDLTPEEKAQFITGLEPIPGGTVLLPSSQARYVTIRSPAIRANECVVIGDKKISIPENGISSSNINFDVEVLSFDNSDLGLEVGECGADYEMEIKAGSDGMLWGSSTNDFQVVVKNLGDEPGDSPLEIVFVDRVSGEEIFGETINVKLKAREKKEVYVNDFMEIEPGLYTVYAEIDPGNEKNNDLFSNRKKATNINISPPALGLNILGDLPATVASSGTASMASINCTSNATGNLSGICEGRFKVGSTVTLTAQFDSSIGRIARWDIQGDNDSFAPLSCESATANSCSFVMRNKISDNIRIILEKQIAIAPNLYAEVPVVSLSSGEVVEKFMVGDSLGFRSRQGVGFADVAATQSRFEVRNLSGGVLFSSTASIPAHVMNSSLAVSSPQAWTPTQAGNYRARFCVDTSGVVLETSESDNCREKDFEVIAKRTITITKNPTNIDSALFISGERGKPSDSVYCGAGCTSKTVSYPNGTEVFVEVDPGEGEIVKRWNETCNNRSQHDSNNPETMLFCGLTASRDMNFAVDFLDCGEDAKDANGILPNGCPKPDIRVSSVTARKDGNVLSPIANPEALVGDEVSVSALVDNVFGKADAEANIPVTLDIYAPPRETQDLSFETKTLSGLSRGAEQSLSWGSFVPQEVGLYLGIVEADPGLSGTFKVDENPSTWENNINFVPIIVKAKPYYDLNVVKTNDGSGIVRINSAVAKEGYRLPQSSINCGSQCSAPFEEDDSVTLEAVPETGTTFKGWSGEGCSGTSGCTVRMTKDREVREVTAEFELKSYPFTVTVDGDSSGTLSATITLPNGNVQTESCTTGCAFPSLKHGTRIRLSGTPAANSELKWTSSFCPTSGVCEFLLSRDTTVKASFNLFRYNFTLNKAGEGTGSFSGTYTEPKRTAKSICSGGCVTSLAHGTVISVNGNPDSRSTFEWSGACTGTGNCGMTLTSAKSATGTFKKKYKKRTIVKTCTFGSDCGVGTIVSRYDGYADFVCDENCTNSTFEVLRGTSGTHIRQIYNPSRLYRSWCYPAANCSYSADGKFFTDVTSSEDTTIYYDIRDTDSPVFGAGSYSLATTTSAEVVGTTEPTSTTSSASLEYVTPEYSTALSSPTPRVVNVNYSAIPTASNVATLPATPDLVSYNLVYYPLRITTGSKVSFYGYVFNEGAATAGASTATIKVSKYNGTTWDVVKTVDLSVPELTRYSGEAVKGENVWDVTSFGRYRFELCADSKNAVSGEKDEGNNCRVLEPGVPTVTVSKTGSGGGRVKSKTSPAQTEINCGATCTGIYQYFSQMLFTAEPNATSRFEQWSGTEQKLTGTKYAGCGSYDAFSGNRAQDGDLDSLFRCNDKTQRLLVGYDLGSDHVIEKARIFVGTELRSEAQLKGILQNQVGCKFAQYLRDIGTGTVDRWSGSCPWISEFNVKDSVYTNLASRLYAGQTITDEKIGIYNTSGDNDGADIILKGSLSSGLTYQLTNRGSNAPSGNSKRLDVFLGKPSDFQNTAIAVSKNGTTWKQVSLISSVPAENAWFEIPVEDLGAYRYVRYNGLQINQNLPEIEFYGRKTNICTGSSSSCNFRVENENQEIGAVFVTRTDSRVSVVKRGSGTGVVRTENLKVDCGGTCEGSFGINEQVTLAATADPEMTFVGFEGVDSSSCTLSAEGKSCTLTLNTDKRIEARFEPTPLIYGDVNGDSKVLASDALKVLKIAVGSEPVPTGNEFKRADVDLNEKITASDALLILKSSVGQLELPKPLFVDRSLKVETTGGEGTLVFESVDAELKEVLSFCQGGCESAVLSPNYASVKVTAVAPTGGEFLGWEGDCVGTGECEIEFDSAKSIRALFSSGPRTDFSVSELSPTKFRVNKKVRVKSVLYNFGENVTGSAVLELRVDEGNNGSWDKELREVQSVKTFRADQYRSFKLKFRDRANFWIPTKDGSYRYQFCAYVDGVSDYYPEDNCSEYRFTLSNGSSRALKRLSKKFKKKKLVIPTVPVVPTSTTTTTTSTTTTVPVTSTTLSTTTTTTTTQPVTTTTSSTTTSTTTTLP